MIFWILLTTFFTVFFICVVAILLPRVFLRNKYKVKNLKDRGIAKYKCGDSGIGMTFQPDPETREYISQYAIAFDGKEKTIKCLLPETTDYIEYDIVLFNNKNKVFDVLNVCDVVSGSGMTREVALPDATSYVSIVVSKVNDISVSKPVKLHVSFLKVLAYSFITLILSVITAFAVKAGIVNSFGGVFREIIMLDQYGHMLTLILTLAMALVGIIIVAIVLATKNSSNNKKARY